MTARMLMRHRATVQRNAAGDDDFGQAAPPDWEDHLTALPCHVWDAADRRVIKGADDIVLTDLKLIVPLGTDITPLDQVAVVVDKRGGTILPGPVLIDDVLFRADHLVCALRAVAPS